jgi:hypothetical protein
MTLPLRIGAPRQRQCLGLGLAALLLPLLLMVVAHHPAALAGTPAAKPPAVVLAVDPECRRYDRCQEDLQSVFGSLDIERLSEELRTPRLFKIAGTLTLQWNPNGHPGWSPEQLALGCRSSVCSFSGWRDQQILERAPIRIWTGRFELQTDEQTSLALYPFDQHWHGMRFLERFQSLQDDLVFAHDLGEIAFSDEHSCLQLINPTILGLAFSSQSLQSILTLL